MYTLGGNEFFGLSIYIFPHSNRSLAHAHRVVLDLLHARFAYRNYKKKSRCVCPKYFFESLSRSVCASSIIPYGYSVYILCCSHITHHSIRNNNPTSEINTALAIQDTVRYPIYSEFLNTVAVPSNSSKFFCACIAPSNSSADGSISISCPHSIVTVLTAVNELYF